MRLDLDLKTLFMSITEKIIATIIATLLIALITFIFRKLLFKIMIRLGMNLKNVFLFIRYRIFKAKKTSSILIMHFDGPGQLRFHINDLIISKIQDEFRKHSSEIKIIVSPDTLTELNGKDQAKKLGNRYKANLVMWGSYGISRDIVLMTIHLEVISSLIPYKFIPLIYQGKPIPCELTVLERGDLQIDLSIDLIAFSYFLLGLLNLVNNNVRRAITFLTYSVDSKSNFFQSIYVRSICYYIVEDYEKALMDINLAINLKPHIYELYINRIEIYFKKQMYIDALNDSEVLVQHLQDKTLAVSIRISANIAIGNDKTVIEDILNLIRDDPNSHLPYYYLGSLFKLHCVYKDAIDCFTLALNNKPNWDEVLLLRGICYQEANESERAIDDFKAVCRCSTNSIVLSDAKKRLSEITKHHKKAGDVYYCLSLLINLF